jgi:hypothetical protein
MRSDNEPGVGIQGCILYFARRSWESGTFKEWLLSIHRFRAHRFLNAEKTQSSQRLLSNGGGSKHSVLRARCIPTSSKLQLSPCSNSTSSTTNQADTTALGKLVNELGLSLPSPLNPSSYRPPISYTLALDFPAVTMAIALAEADKYEVLEKIGRCSILTALASVAFYTNS